MKKGMGEEIKQQVQIDQYTVNEARKNAGLTPLTDPAADIKLFVQGDEVSGGNRIT